MELTREWEEIAHGQYRSPTPSIYPKLRQERRHLLELGLEGQGMLDRLGLPAQLNKWKDFEKQNEVAYEADVAEYAR